MMKKILLVAIISTTLFGAACSGDTTSNGNSSSINSNSATNVPPEFQNINVTPSGNSTPGIPPANQANVNLKPDSNGMIAPGIPANTKIGNTAVKKGATPTPGIPDPETLKKQANTLIKDANVVNQAPKTVKEAENQIKQGIKTVRKP